MNRILQIIAGFLVLVNIGGQTVFGQVQHRLSGVTDLGYAVEGILYREITFESLPDVKTREELKERGVILYEHLEGLSWLASIREGSTVLFERNAGFRFAGVDLYRKMSTPLIDGEPCGISDLSSYKMIIQHMPGIPDKKINALAEHVGLRIEKYNSDHRLFFAYVNIADWRNLAREPWIQFVSCAPMPGEPEDREGRGMHRVNLVANNKLENLFLDGSGVKVCVRDDGFVGPHIDFKNRITNDVFGGNGTHGDMVSGILCGAGNIDPVIEGMATGAELFVINYQDDFLDKTMDLHQINGVVITNSSYSNGCNAGYTALSQIVDRQIFQNPSLLHVFSAGNSNNLDCGYGAGNQWGNITGGHKIGKNVLTAANLQLSSLVDPSSSRGPTRDGRLSPHISARGTNQLSTQDGNIYQVGGGTSAASPGVAGVATLLYDAYKRFNGGVNPPSALIKATIMNTATDIGTPGPDYIYGYGVIDAYQAYKTLEQKRYQSFRIAQNQVREFDIQIPLGSTLAKFMIYWAEREASLSARKVLINDIDMEVISPTGTVLLPLVPNPTPNPGTLAEGAKPGVDTLNNAEQVMILAPEAGTYKVRIKGKFLPDVNVDMFLLHHFELETLRLTYPIGGEKLNTLEAIQIYYTSNSSDSINVRYSVNGGVSWVDIRSLPGNTRQTNWTIPLNINSDSCMVELRQGNNSVRSGLFTIAAGVTGMRVSKYCPGEVTLSWNASNRDSFLIYTMGEKYMQPFRVVDTNRVTISVTPPISDWWFSVAGYRNGVLSRRNKAISIPDTLVACNVQNDLAVKLRTGWESRFYLVCGSEARVRPEVFVYNRNVNRVTGFKIQYQSGGNLVTDQFDVNINYRDSILVTLKEGIQLDFEGTRDIPIWVELTTDENPYNDTVRASIEVEMVADNKGVFPLAESFDQGEIPSDWVVRNPIPVSDWAVSSQVQANGQAGLVLGYSNPTISYVRFPLDLYTHTIDLSQTTDPYLYFDYAYHKFSGSFNLPDSFYVDIYPVCEGSVSAKRIFFSGYTDIFTVDSSSNRNWVPRSATDWKGMTFDLSDYKGRKVVINFGFIRGLNGHFFMDNINIRERKSETLPIDISRDPENICISNTARFQATNDPRLSLYRWDFGLNATPRIALGPGPHNIRFSSGGPRIITLRLVSPTIDIIKTREIQIYNTPAPSFLFEVQPDKRTVKFNNQSTQIQSVLWDFGDGNTSTELSPLYSYAAPGVYSVRLTISNACGSNSNSRVIDLIGSSVDDQVQKWIRLSPNPFNDLLVIDSEEDLKGIRIISTDGKTQEILISQNGQRQYLLQTGHWKSGVYYVGVMTQRGLIYEKTIKE
jgi:hypothetical protein